jgi:hypothetical protein
MLLLSGTFLAFMVGGATFVNWLVEPDMVRARARTGAPSRAPSRACGLTCVARGLHQRVPKMRVNPQTLAFELVEELQPRQQPQPPAAPTAPKS